VADCVQQDNVVTDGVLTYCMEHGKDDRCIALHKLKRLGVPSHPVRHKMVEGIRQLFSHARILGALHTLLIAPIAQALSGAEEVLIIPHRDLFAVPWAALMNDDDKSYLIEHYSIRVAPSLSVARAAATSVSAGVGKTKHKVVVVGNPIPNSVGPLPGAKAEALAVLQVLCDSEWDKFDTMIASRDIDLVLPLKGSRRIPQKSALYSIYCTKRLRADF